MDEVGCTIWLNSNLHSKLILSNDLGLVGSFNLSIAALYDREEIGISVDDMENLKVLDNYVYKVIGSSKHYGGDFPPIDGKVTGKVTRGWLYEDIVRQFSEDLGNHYDSYSSHIFLNGFFGTIYASDVMEKVSLGLEGFYVKAILAYLESEAHSDEQRLGYLRRRFGYHGRHEINEILDFLKNKLARDHVPKISPIAQIVPKSRRRLLGA